MKLLILTSISGVNGSYSKGDEVEWPDEADAKRLIDAEIARELKPTKITLKKTTKK